MTSSQKKHYNSKKVTFKEEEPKNNVNPFIHLRSLEGLGILKNQQNTFVPGQLSRSTNIITKHITRKLRNNTFISQEFEHLLSSTTRIRALSNKQRPKYDTTINNNSTSERKTIDYNKVNNKKLKNNISISRSTSQTSQKTAHLRNDSSLESYFSGQSVSRYSSLAQSI